jgi:TRAP-type C4-dicarboxylate transport system substrate-binding protein
MSMKAMSLLLKLCCCVFLMGIAPVGSCYAGGYSLRLANFLPAAHISNRAVLKPFADQVRYQSGGGLSIRVYADGQLGRNPREQLELVEKGIADIALINPYYYPELFSDLNVVSLPNRVQTATQGSLALTKSYERGFLRKYSGFIPLALFTTYPALIHATHKIENVRELKNLRIPSSGGLLRDVLLCVGAQPKKMNYGEMYMGLQRGQINAVALSWRSLYEGRFYEVTKYHYTMPMGANPIVLAMNRHRFESLPRDQQRILLDLAGERLAAVWGKAYDAINKSYERRFEADSGHTIIRPSSGDGRHLDEITERITEDWLSRGNRTNLFNVFGSASKR